MSTKNFRLMDKPFYYLSISIFSFTIIALETIFFHLLLNLSNYMYATSVISLALLGIAMGGIFGFFLYKVRMEILMFFANIIFFFSFALSYYNIINIGSLHYPVFLILPFFSGSLIISLIFTKTQSNRTYFANLLASALGVIFPVLAVPVFGSENCLFILAIIPPLFFLFLALKTNKYIIRIPLILLFFAGCGVVGWGLHQNVALPEVIPAADIESGRLTANIRQPFQKKFLKRIYQKDSSGSFYTLQGDKYDKKRASYILKESGYLKPGFHLWFNVRRDPSFKDYMNKIYSPTNNIFKNDSLVFSEDHLCGRVEMLSQTSNDYVMAVNGTGLDILDQDGPLEVDPRVPQMDNASVFIIGLSADGIIKSVKGLNNPTISGIEINPVISRIMEENGQFSRFSRHPYKNIEVHHGEARSFLERTKKKFDLITLMNIHADNGPNCTLEPEYFHNIESIDLLLNRLTSKGMLDFEEIVMNDRSTFGFLKFMNTIYKTLEKRKSEDPLRQIIIFSWNWKPGNVFRTVLVKNTPFSVEDLKTVDKFLSKVKTHYTNTEILLYPGKETHSGLEIYMKKSETKRFNAIFIPSIISGGPFKHDLIEKITSPADFAIVTNSYSIRPVSGRYFIRALDKKRSTLLLDVFRKVKWPLNLDLSPSTDVKPFPFDVYKDKKEITDLLKLILCLTAVLLFPVLLILIIRIIKTGQGGGLLGHSVFFSLLGAGYMMIEIVLIQRYQIFIGNPTYSLIVVLGGLLLFSGIGSLVSQRFPKWLIFLCILMIPILIMLKIFYLDDIFKYFSGTNFNLRLLLASGLIFPLGFMMGIPFPHALELLKKEHSPDYATLMYGISGIFSTVAATASILISVICGFTVTLISGASCYLIALILLILITSPTNPRLTD